MAHEETTKYGPYIPRGKKSIETVPEEAHMLYLLDQDFKLAILNMFKELKGIISKELKESMRTMSYQIENINKKQTKGGECHGLRCRG